MKILLPIVIILVSVLAAGIIARPRDKADEGPEVIAPRNIEVLRAELTEAIVHVESRGFLEARTMARISAEVSGRVMETSDKLYPGEFVREGDLLIKIDSSNYEAALKLAEAQLARAEVSLAEEVARSEQARVDWERVGESAPSPLTLREPQLAEARANILAAEADLEKAKRDVERTQIFAPFDALIETREVAEGQFLGAGGTVAQILAIDFAEVRLPITSKEIPFVSLPSTKGNQTELPTVKLIAQDGGLPVERIARVVRTENVIDRESRVLFAIARLDDPYARLSKSDKETIRIGSFVTAELESSKLKNVFKIPSSAVKGVDKIAIVDDENKITFRETEVVLADGAYVYVRRGIEEGDLICLTSPQSLYTGTLVTWSQDQE
ncbi:MAG: efflux RND transporter periplasmic adaptor subunit [Verrucomicrobiota bacterium]